MLGRRLCLADRSAATGAELLLFFKLCSAICAIAHLTASSAGRRTGRWNLGFTMEQILGRPFQKPHLQSVGNFLGQRFNLLYAARAGEVHDPNECFSFADHDHAVR